MEIILVPESLRAKLGDEALKELIEIINSSSRKAKDEAVEAVNRLLDSKNAETRANLEKLIIETKAELRELVLETHKKIAETKVEIIKWMFGFWIGQIAVYLLLRYLIG